MINYKDILKEIKENPYIFSLFVISTSYFLYQHFTIISWDFSAYVLNAKYLFYHGDYFEVYRAPFAPLILGVFLVFGKISEYLFIIFVSVLFLFSNISLSNTLRKKIKISDENKIFFNVLFYFFSLSSYVLFYSTQ